MKQEKRVWEKSPAELFRELQCGEEGLTAPEARARLERYGPNELASGQGKSVVRVFLEQFRDFLVALLLLAAAVYAALGDGESALVILAVITMNAVLGTVQTVKAAASLESLRRMSAPEAKAVREGRVTRVPGREVVPGDVVVLEAGDAVCADGRLLECAGLKCDESALTGESLPSEKTEGPICGDVPLGDRKNMVFAGSFVTCGRGRFLVTAAGMDTEMGKIAALLRSTEEKKTPLQVSMDQFGRRLSVIIVLICAVLFAISVAVRREDPTHAFLLAVALAVAAIPEALSSIVTIVLALGTAQMAREHAVIRNLQAVEGLGSVSVICSDKTGTLTQNRMTVKKLYAAGRVLDAREADFGDPALEPLLRAALLCSDAVVNENGETGDPTETALVRLGEDHGFDEEAVRSRWPRLAELPFDSRRKLMSTVHRMEGGYLLVTKGAPDVLLDRCALSDGERARAEAANEAFSREGLRVLAFACRPLERRSVCLADEDSLDFLGLIAMMDPPREAAKQAVAECAAAGIRPVMITGDHKATAAAIAREVGILTQGTLAVEGSVLDTMSDAELRELVPKVSVYARVAPEHKLRIVRAWQDRGELVAMTGDGVNDAPALKQADIGVAMGATGTEVAKDAAAMVLTDDNFATIVRAVKNGRNIYANIQKAIRFLLSGNAAGILTVVYASLAGLPVPFEAVHLLFINLLTDSLPAIALGLEPHSDDVMTRRPRPRSQGILTRDFLAGVGTEGLVMAAATVIAFHIGLAESLAAGSTMAFAALCLSRLLHGFSCKSSRPVVLTKRLWDNRWLLGAFAAGAVLLALVLLVPALEPLFKAAELSAGQLGAVASLSLGSLAVIQGLKAIRK